MHSLQIATFMFWVMNFCSSAKEETFEKKCPPEGYHIQPLKFGSIEDYKMLFSNWRVQKCCHELYCEHLKCMEFTCGKSEEGIIFHGSAFNTSSSKMWTPHGFFTQSKSGGMDLHSSDKRAKGEFHLLALSERFYFIVACFENKSFGGWICSKAGKKLDERDTKQLKEIAKKNGFKWEDFKEPPNEDCEKIKAGY